MTGRGREWGFVGSVSLVMHGEVGFFYYWIGRDFQGYGIGPEAVQLLLQAARERGDQQVVLSTAKNAGARFSGKGFAIMIKRSHGDDQLAACVGAAKAAEQAGDAGKAQEYYRKVVTIAADVPSDAPDLVLSPTDWSVVAHLDGRRSIADITRLLGASAFDVCATLHRLVIAGAARVVD